mmetsp:Transcript_67444/g.158196  ORF Transcript_67444/g.158196 Transcript_67444/m.158196 type:complete len:151 (-) Transcript_67444:29-481(-)
MLRPMSELDFPRRSSCSYTGKCCKEVSREIHGSCTAASSVPLELLNFNQLTDGSNLYTASTLPSVFRSTTVQSTPFRASAVNLCTSSRKRSFFDFLSSSEDSEKDAALASEEGAEEPHAGHAWPWEQLELQLGTECLQAMHEANNMAMAI